MSTVGRMDADSFHSGSSVVQQSSSPPPNRHASQMYLVDLRSHVSDTDSRRELFTETAGVWETLCAQMDPEELLWVVAPNEYRSGELWPVAMATAEQARSEAELTLKNTVTVHDWRERGGEPDLQSAHVELLLLVSDQSAYQFHKDEIRIAHAYQGNEWGEDRQEGNSSYHDTTVRRYNPEGRDPGNVWVDADRTQTEGQEVDEITPFPLSEAVRRCVRVGSSEGDRVSTLWTDELDEVIIAENREVARLDPETARPEPEDTPPESTVTQSDSEEAPPRCEEARPDSPTRPSEVEN